MPGHTGVSCPRPIQDDCSSVCAIPHLVVVVCVHSNRCYRCGGKGHIQTECKGGDDKKDRSRSRRCVLHHDDLRLTALHTHACTEPLFSRSPRKRSASPARKRSASPDRKRSASPDRKRSASPDRKRSASPKKDATNGDVRDRSRSPSPKADAPAPAEQ